MYNWGLFHKRQKGFSLNKMDFFANAMSRCKIIWRANETSNVWKQKVTQFSSLLGKTRCMKMNFDTMNQCTAKGYGTVQHSAEWKGLLETSEFTLLSLDVLLPFRLFTRRSTLPTQHSTFIQINETFTTSGIISFRKSMYQVHKYSCSFNLSKFRPSYRYTSTNTPSEVNLTLYWLSIRSVLVKHRTDDF